MDKTLTLTLTPDEVATLQRVVQKGNADLPTLHGLASLTRKVAALSDPDPVEVSPAPTAKEAKEPSTARTR